MGKEEYRLTALYGLREKAKEEAERILAQAMRALKEEQTRLEEMQAELERMIASRKAKAKEYAEKQMRGEMSAQAMISAQSYLERLKEQEQAQERTIEGQQRVIEQREKEVDRARQGLAEATQELKALEKHKEKWEKEQKRKRQLKEEELLDELAQTIHLGKTREN